MQVWRGAAVLYLLFCLLGLAVGFWPESLVVPKSGEAMLPPPTLSCLGAAQVAFFLLVYPLAMFRRGQRCWGASLGECAVMLLAAAPFYAAATYVSDGTVIDGVRVAFAMAAVVPPAIAAGRWMVRGVAWRAAATLAMVAAALGLPAMVYVSCELVGGAGADALWNVGPATFVWSNAQMRSGTTIPVPFWPCAAWLATAAAMELAALAFPGRSTGQGESQG